MGAVSGGPPARLWRQHWARFGGALGRPARRMPAQKPHPFRGERSQLHAYSVPAAGTSRAPPRASSHRKEGPPSERVEFGGKGLLPTPAPRKPLATPNTMNEARRHRRPV